MALKSILRRPLLHQSPLAPPTPLQERGKSLTRSRFSCPPVTWLKSHDPFHAGSRPQAPSSDYMQIQRRPQSWKRPPGREQSWAREKLRVTTQTDLHPRTDLRPKEFPLSHASPRSASAVPPVQPVLWVLVVPPHWSGGGTARLTTDPRQRGIQTSHSAADRRRCSTATTRPFTQIRFSSVEDGSLMPRPVLRSLENPAELTWVLAGLRDLGASVPPQPAVPAPRRAQPHGLIGSWPPSPAPQHSISSEACVSRPIPTPIGSLPPTTPHWLVIRSRPGGNQVWAGP